MHPVCETVLSVRIELKEVPSLPEVASVARILVFVPQLEELMGRMNPTTQGPTEPHVRLVGKILPKTWENCRDTHERKPRTQAYDDLIDLAMERESDSHMDKYMCKHLRRESPAERNP